MPLNGTVTVTSPGPSTTVAATPTAGVVHTTPGVPGPPGSGVQLEGAVAVYADLPDDLGPDDAGAAYVVQSNGKLYVWSGTAWPTEANGADFRGEKGDTGDTGPVGETGATGATGATGPAGPANTLTVGTVASGETAAATITGTSPAQVLNLTLPQGEQGPQGDPGADSTVEGPAGPANTLTIGTVTQGAAAASITGTSPNQILNLTLEKGEKGDKGDPGGSAWVDITGKPATFPPGAHTHLLADVSDVTATAAEVNYTDGVTSPIQTQLNGKAATAHTHAQADVTNLTSDLAGKVPTTRTVSAGTGLSGGGDLSANRSFTVTYGTTAGTACQGNDARLSDSRTPTTHTHAGADITSGTIGYARLPVGTAASTVAAGNDARLTDTRTPTDNTVTSAKIVDGAIVNGDINASAAIALSKLAAGAVTGTVNGTATNTTVWRGTQSQYDAIGSKDANTIYFITA